MPESTAKSGPGSLTPEERAEAAVDWLSIPDADGEYDDERRDANKQVIAAAIREAVAEEREACAKVADDFDPVYNPADRIRARP